MFEAIETFIKELKNNNMAQTGIVMLFGGSAVGLIYKLYFKVINLISYLCFVTISFDSIDYLTFKKIQYWLYNHPYTKKRCTNFNIRFLYRDSEETNKQIFYPGYGNHYFFINKRPAVVSYSKSDSKELAFRENINISLFALFNKAKRAEKLLEEINKLFDQDDYNRTQIFSCCSSYGTWKELLTKGIKQDPILSHENEYQELLDDVSSFINNEQWYADRGISYKRGYLLSGKPGAGKTSCIISVAQKFKKQIYIVNLTSTAIDDAKFIELITSLGKDAILAIEDIDGIYVDRSRDRKDEKEANTVTLSTILNTLDGLFTPDGLLFFITTNYPEKLDKALIRHGRISVFKEFDNANEYQARSIFTRFFPEATENQIKKFSSMGIGKSMACLESHLIKKCF